MSPVINQLPRIKQLEEEHKMGNCKIPPRKVVFQFAEVQLGKIKAHEAEMIENRQNMMSSFGKMIKAKKAGDEESVKKAASDYKKAVKKDQELSETHMEMLEGLKLIEHDLFGSKDTR